MVSILAGVGRPHKEIQRWWSTPRTGKPIDDVTLRLRFPEELWQAKAKVSLKRVAVVAGKVRFLRMHQRPWPSYVQNRSRQGR
jgi:hypothetical protein